MKRQLKHGYMIHVLNYPWFVMPTLAAHFMPSPWTYCTQATMKTFHRVAFECKLPSRSVLDTEKDPKYVYVKCVFNSFQFASWSIQWRDFVTGPGISLEGKEQPAIRNRVEWWVIRVVNDTWWDLEMRRGRFTDLTTEIIHLMIFICCHTMPHQCSPKERKVSDKQKEVAFR